MAEVTAERQITIKLSEYEATILCALLGGVQHTGIIPAPGGSAAVVYELFQRLDENICRLDSFSDYFDGEVTAL
jgi:hypothetical protein